MFFQVHRDRVVTQSDDDGDIPILGIDAWLISVAIAATTNSLFIAPCSFSLELDPR
jgi:hypothetical protein